MYLANLESCVNTQEKLESLLNLSSPFSQNRTKQEVENWLDRYIIFMEVSKKNNWPADSIDYPIEWDFLYIDYLNAPEKFTKVFGTVAKYFPSFIKGYNHVNCKEVSTLLNSPSKEIVFQAVSRLGTKLFYKIYNLSFKDQLAFVVNLLERSKYYSSYSTIVSLLKDYEKIPSSQYLQNIKNADNYVIKYNYSCDVMFENAVKSVCQFVINGTSKNLIDFINFMLMTYALHDDDNFLYSKIDNLNNFLWDSFKFIQKKNDYVKHLTPKDIVMALLDCSEEKFDEIVPKTF